MSAPFYAWLNLLHVLQVPRAVIMMDPDEALFMRLTQARVSAPCWRAGLIVSSQGRAALYALHGADAHVARRIGECAAQTIVLQRAGGALAPKIDGARCLLLEEEGPEEVEKRLNEILNAPVR